MTRKQASEAYIKGKLRMTLIQSNMYTVRKAFEDGWDAAIRKYLEE